MKVALIGAGGIGQAHSEAYVLIPEAQIVAVVDVRSENAQKIAKHHGARAYTSLDEMLKNEKPDMADICTPSYTHKDVSIQCLDHGLHVLCEKPIAHTLQDAQAIVQAAQSNHALFMIAQVIRFWPEYAYLKKVYDEKTYGRLLQVFFSRTSGAPLWAWENWYVDPKRSGRAPFELHIHDADFIYYLLGRPRQMRSIGYERVELYASYLKTQFIYDTDVLVEAEGGWFQGPIPFAATYRAVFERATLDYKNDELLRYLPGEADPQKVDLSSGVSISTSINLKNAGGIYNEIAYFVNCVKAGTPPQVITPQESVDVLSMLLKEIESAKTGHILDI